MGKYNYYCCGRYYQRMDLDTIDLSRREYDGYKTQAGGWVGSWFVCLFVYLFID